VAAGRIFLESAENDPQRNSLTSHLGRINPPIDRNQMPLPLLPGDLVLLCSDGLYGVLTEAEIAAAAQGNAQLACQSLLRLALSRGRPDQDNVTILALDWPAEKSPGHCSGPRCCW
jgi:protein phosphatase